MIRFAWRNIPDHPALLVKAAADEHPRVRLAAMVAAVAEVPIDAGTISFIITGDEEGPAIHGTRALIDRIRARGDLPDLCLVGEPP